MWLAISGCCQKSLSRTFAQTLRSLSKRSIPPRAMATRGTPWHFSIISFPILSSSWVSSMKRKQLPAGLVGETSEAVRVVTRILLPVAAPLASSEALNLTRSSTPSSHTSSSTIRILFPATAICSSSSRAATPSTSADPMILLTRPARLNSTDARNHTCWEDCSSPEVRLPRNPFQVERRERERQRVRECTRIKTCAHLKLGTRIKKISRRESTEFMTK